MSYVHLRNALFLQPLPELSSVRPSQQQRHHEEPSRNKAGLAGIFTSGTVPQNLVATPNPLGQGTPGRSPADASAKRQAEGAAAGGTTGGAAMARELGPVTLQGDTAEVGERFSILLG